MTDSRDRLAERRGADAVYQPAEDTRLLCETAVSRVHGDDRVLEVGTGSGYVADTIASESDARVIATDISPLAVREAADRVRVVVGAAGGDVAGSGRVEVVRADLFAPFRDASFDVVLCNPPYLPTDPDVEWDDWMERALSGGPDGRRLVDPFVDGVARVLRTGGRALLLISTLTDPAAVEERAESNGLACEEVASEAFPFERLLVLEITTKH